MEVVWFDSQNDAQSGAQGQSLTGLTKKFESFEASNDDDAYHIIATNRKLGENLLKGFSKLDNNFPNQNLRFGWIENEGVDVNKSEVPSGPLLIVGEDNHIQGHFIAVSSKNLVISSRSSIESTHIAYQRHFNTSENPQSISLGDMIKDPSDAETLIRTAKTVEFNIDAVRYEDSHSEHSPTAGLDIYQCCNLMRLAGLSKRLEVTYINVIDKVINARTTELVTTMIWYFLEGQINKEIETMKQKENDIFLVSSELLEEPIKFVVGHKTGRWWYQHPSTKEYLPCSDKDYKAISTGSLPDAIISLQN